MPYSKSRLTGKLACLEMKMIGKPYVGKLQVRFDEGRTGRLSMEDPKRALTLDDKLLGQTQRGETDGWSALVRVV